MIYVDKAALNCSGQYTTLSFAVLFQRFHSTSLTRPAESVLLENSSDRPCSLSSCNINDVKSHQSNVMTGNELFFQLILLACVHT